VELIGLIFLQVMLGLFFTITGARKSFGPARRMVFGLFERLNVPKPAGWAVVLGQFFGGIALLTGILSQLAAFLLLPIMLGAYFLDTIPTIRGKNPADRWDWCAKLICNAEAQITIGLVVLATGNIAY
jgi:putative oxidoreductase